MSDPGLGRHRRLAEELEESGLVLDGTEASRALLLEEVDHAVRPDVHERRVVSSGTILDPQSDPATWEPGTQLEMLGLFSRNGIPASAGMSRNGPERPGSTCPIPGCFGGSYLALAITSRRARILPLIRTRTRKLLKRNRGIHMNFGSTLVHNASVDFINLLWGTSAL